MNTLTQTNLFEIENQHIANLSVSLAEFKAKIENLEISGSETLKHADEAIAVIDGYVSYLDEHEDVPGYSHMSQIHKDLRAIFEDMYAALSTDGAKNDFLDFDASQILKSQQNHRRDLCTVASDHTLGRLRKSGNELLEMAKALNA